MSGRRWMMTKTEDETLEAGATLACDNRCLCT